MGLLELDSVPAFKVIPSSKAGSRTAGDSAASSKVKRGRKGRSGKVVKCLIVTLAITLKRTEASNQTDRFKPQIIAATLKGRYRLSWMDGSTDRRFISNFPSPITAAVPKLIFPSPSFLCEKLGHNSLVR